MKKTIRITESQLKQIIENEINEYGRAGGNRIISIERSTQDIDVANEFRMYKYAVSEHEPIKLSNGNWLHVYRVTNYLSGAHGDPDEEQSAFEKEMY